MEICFVTTGDYRDNRVTHDVNDSPCPFSPFLLHRLEFCERVRIGPPLYRHDNAKHDEDGT